jgi:lipid-A-disaccharide synthase
MVVLLPGSRAGEATRHLPILLDAITLLRMKLTASHHEISVVLATPKGFEARRVFATFRERINALSIKVIENEPWDCIGHADLALAASGTVTMEAAILGTPMVTFYKVTALSWHAGRRLVKVPFLSMVNLVAERGIVPELIQNDMTPAKIAEAAYQLLTDPAKAVRMRADLAQVRLALTRTGDPFERAAQSILQVLQIGQEKME